MRIAYKPASDGRELNLSTGEGKIQQNKPRRNAESNFIGLLNFIADPAIIVDGKGRFLVMNNAFMDLTGLKKNELTGTAFFDLKILNAENKALLLEKLAKRMQGITVDPYEINFQTRAGESRYAEVKAKKINYAGNPADLVIFHDITRRKENARRLKEYSEKMEALVNDKVKEVKESEEKFRNLSEESPNMIFIYKKGRVTYANKKCEDLMGYTKEEFYAPTFNFFTLIAPESQEKLNSSHKRHTEGQEVAPYEYTLLTKAGKRINAVLTSKLIKYEGENATLGIVTDITERKKMEDALRQERKMLEAVTENIGAGLAIISKDYHILWANKLMKQINGDCQGKKCYSTFNKLTDICPDCGVKKIFEKGVPIDTHEYSTKDDKGHTMWIEIIVTPIKDKTGKIIAALELAVNITERKGMQDKLAEYSQKLKKLVEKRTEQLKQTQAKLVKSERLAAIGELAAMVGHDLRNPLTGIKGAAYYLKAKHCSEIGDRGKEMLESIENAIDYSNKIVNDLLEYSRELKLELTETTPKAMLKKALASLEIPEEIKIVDATADEPKVKADIEQMCRVFINLIKNAVDAMPEGGTLTIKSKEAKGTLKITFKDTGTGMTEKTLRTLKRGVPLFTTKAKGMRFGLPICKRIAEAHGGKLSLESNIGKGTKITVTIPVNSKPADEVEEKWIFSEFMLSKITASHGPPR